MAFVHARSEGPIDFDSLLASLSQHCPGTELLDDNYCASRISKLVEMSRAVGKSDDNLVISRALETVRKLGQTRQIRVPLANGIALVGTVSNSAVLLASNEQVTSEDLFPVLAALEAFPKLEARIALDTEPKKYEPVCFEYRSFHSKKPRGQAANTSEPSSRPKRPWWKIWA